MSDIRQRAIDYLPMPGDRTITLADNIIAGLVVEIYKQDKEIQRLRGLLEKIHDALEYGDVYQWDDGQEFWQEMRDVVGEQG